MSSETVDLTAAEAHPVYSLVKDVEAFHEFASRPDDPCPCGDCDLTVEEAAWQIAQMADATVGEGYLSLYLVSVQQ